jgi:hypothetical protein
VNKAPRSSYFHLLMRHPFFLASRSPFLSNPAFSASQVLSCVPILSASPIHSCVTLRHYPFLKHLSFPVYDILSFVTIFFLRHRSSCVTVLLASPVLSCVNHPFLHHDAFHVSLAFLRFRSIESAAARDTNDNTQVYVKIDSWSYLKY